MASGKERQRWERWYDQVTARMRAQAKSIQRLVLLLTEATAALHEIAEIAKESHRPCEWEAACGRASARAQAALDRIEGSAAAVASDAEELVTSEDPEDPRNRRA